tara:strand:- start:62709 stop:63740 length:1032 start_codon:yes stop_codon:yes gene_type:complete
VTDQDSPTRPVPIIVNFDIEPDEHYIDRNRPEPWHGFEAAFPLVDEIRERIYKYTGCSPHFTWILRADKQIKQTYGAADWALERYGSELEQLRAAGDEVGVHTHMYRWDKNLNDWIQDFMDTDHIRECIEMGIHAMRKHGYQPETHSVGGIHWMSNELRDFLIDQGIQYDLTLKPGEKGQTISRKIGQVDCEPIDGRPIPQQPYRSCSEDFRLPAKTCPTNLWFIPLSVQLPDYGIRPALRRLRNKLIGHDRSETRRFILRRGPENFRETFEHRIRTESQPHFMAVLRTATFSRSDLLAGVMQSIDYIVSHPQADRFRFATPGETISLLGLAGTQQDSQRSAA